MSRTTKSSRSKATVARVAFDPALRSALVNLPLSLYAPLVERGVAPQSLVVELAPNDSQAKRDGSSSSPQKYYAGWTGMGAAPVSVRDKLSAPASEGSDSIELHPSLAEAAGLFEGSLVSITLLRSPPLLTATRVDVTPLSADDWEILSLHAEEVEINMLGQVRATCVGQTLLVWVGRGGRTTVRFRVDSTEPPTSPSSSSTSSLERAVRLSTDTEIVITPKVRASTAVDETSHDLRAPAKPTTNGSPVSTDARAQAEATSTLAPMLWRVLPSSFGPTSRKGDATGPDWWKNTALVPPGQARSLLSTAFPTGRCAVTKVPCPSVPADAPSSSHGATSNGPQERGPETGEQDAHARGAGSGAFLPARPTASAYFADGEGYLAEWPTRHVWLGRELMQGLGVEDYDLVRFSPPPPGSSSRPTTPISKPPSSSKGLSSGILNDNKSQLTNGVSAPNDLSAHADADAEPEQRALAGVDKILDTCTELAAGCYETRALMSVQSSLDAGPASRGEKRGVRRFAGASGLMLTGGAGAGKTVVAREICARLGKDERTLAHSTWIDCAKYVDERVPTLRERFSEWMDRASWHAPSVLVLDNLDKVIPAEMEHVDSPRSRQLAESFVSLARRTVSEHAVFVLVTAQSAQSIHPLFNTCHLFSETVQLRPPDKAARREVLAHLIRAKTRASAQAHAHAVSVHDGEKREKPNKSLREKDINHVALATMTEGYLAADLRDLVERAVHQAAIRSVARKESSAEEMTLTMPDFTAAQEGFTPLSLRDVKLEKSDVEWSDIGGLAETRRVLRETLEWPTKYAAIFASCPLRLRSGLLLYGYPGCGKTLLASAVAKECGLNFISVKGPEILNKYIGASEKSVRDLFDRASAAKPCILFFDEFDSIAPKRGHDSTGVTDRVVNQMLTQMDGAEGLDGVYVLAATSRPDLIDSALLRPGRLDKSLLCDMPSHEDRVEILQAIARKVHLAPSVDLNLWASRTEGYSGADLQAVLYNAHLETIHDSIAASADAGAGGSQTNGAVNSAVKDEEGEEKPVQFVAFGGGKEKKATTMSGAEQQALRRRLELMLANSGKSTTNQDSKTRRDAAPRAKALVTDAHIERSLKATRPSVPVEERHRLEKIYRAFVGDRDGTFPDGAASEAIGARSSLM